MTATVQRIKWRLAFAWLLLLGIGVSCARAHGSGDTEGQASRVALLERTLVPVEQPQALVLPALHTERGEVFPPERLREHLAHFDVRIRGLTGSADDVTRFSDALGAAASATARGIDHSTSLFVIDPDGRLAGLLLHPSDPAQILADLDSLNVRYLPARIASR